MGQTAYTAESLEESIRAPQSARHAQQELADAVGTSRKFINKLEAGEEDASLGLVLRVPNKLGFDEPGTFASDAQGQHFIDQFELTVKAHNYEYVLRLIAEYARASLKAHRALLPTTPRIKDAEYMTALGAITRWLSRKTETPAPKWPRNLLPAD